MQDADILNSLPKYMTIYIYSMWYIVLPKHVQDCFLLRSKGSEVRYNFYLFLLEIYKKPIFLPISCSLCLENILCK